MYQIAGMIDAVRSFWLLFSFVIHRFCSKLLYGVWVLVQIILLRSTLERKEENIFNLETPT